MSQTVVGIDVGSQRKGFHAVALRDSKFSDKTTNLSPAAIVGWALDHKPVVVAVDAPCRWSKHSSSRLAERELMRQVIWCFSSPTKQRALESDFYDWMLNGKRLYQCLESHRYPRFDGDRNAGPMCIETFPHAIVCALAGRVVPAKPKSSTRREAFQKRGYDTSSLPNIDFLDAALCAVAAEEFRNDACRCFGNPEEGFIVVPGHSCL